MISPVERIEILSVSYLKNNPERILSFKRLSQTLDIELGWHYLLDLSWAASNLNLQKNSLVLDAGAGWGIMQWWISEQGVNVLSVDRNDRRQYPLAFHENFPIYGYRDTDIESLPDLRLRNFLPSYFPGKWRNYPNKLRNTLKLLSVKRKKLEGLGKIYIYNQNLTDLNDVKEGSVDEVVSISALEHNTPEALKASIKELMRVLKPGGRLIATVAASKNQNWYHQPSQGWCYSEETLREIFDISCTAESNFHQYDQLMFEIKNSVELQENLASFYFSSGENGMPWGKWDPQYQPVGVVKIKN